MRKVQWLDYLWSENRGSFNDVVRSFNMPLPDTIDEAYDCAEILQDKYGVDFEVAVLKSFPEYDGIKRITEEELKQKTTDFHDFSGESSYMENRLNKLETTLELSAQKTEIESVKRWNMVLMVAVVALMVAKFNK